MNTSKCTPRHKRWQLQCNPLAWQVFLQPREASQRGGKKIESQIMPGCPQSPHEATSLLQASLSSLSQFTGLPWRWNRTPRMQRGFGNCRAVAVSRQLYPQQKQTAPTSTWGATREPAEASLQGLGDTLLAPKSLF